MENPLEVWAKYGFEEGYTGIYPPILPMSYIDLYIYIYSISSFAEGEMSITVAHPIWIHAFSRLKTGPIQVAGGYSPRA